MSKTMKLEIKDLFIVGAELDMKVRSDKLGKLRDNLGEDITLVCNGKEIATIRPMSLDVNSPSDGRH